MLDWNTFFSTVAQTAAALLGVVLAFLVAKILGEGQDYDRLQKETDDLLLESEDIKSAMGNINFDWHDWIVFKEAEIYNNRTELIALGQKTTGERVEYLKSNLPRVYFPDIVLEDLEARIAEAIEHRDCEIANRRTGTYQQEFGGNRLVSTPATVWDRVREIESEFGNLKRQTSSTIKRFKNQSTYIRANIRDFTSLQAPSVNIDVAGGEATCDTVWHSGTAS